MESPVACGRRNGSRSIAADMRICMATIHQRLLFSMSTKGLQRGFITHGR